MSTDRQDQLLALLATSRDAGDGAAGSLGGICALCVSEVAVSGARVRVLGGVTADGGGVLVFSTDDLGTQLDDLANIVGAGPCIDAFEFGRPVLVPDLAAERVRWPGFTADAVTAGVAAIFSFPLQLGAARVGVLELHRAAPGPLSNAQLTDAFLLTDAATAAIFDDLHGTEPADSSLLGDVQAEVHQATGFVAIDLGVSLAEALMRIRGYAFAHQLTLAEVARAIIERRLRLANGE